MEILDIIDIKSAKERFMNNEKLYTKFLYQFPDKSYYIDLKRELDNQNIEEAFKIAHDIKGVSGNLSLKYMYDPLIVVLEHLRQGQMPSIQEIQKLEETYIETNKCIRDIQTRNIKLF